MKWDEAQKMADILTVKSRNTCKNKLFNHTTSQTYINKDSYQLKTVTGNSSLYLHCSNNGVYQKDSSDHLGSAQLITNYKGEEYERLEYTPYGELWIEKASAVSIIEIPYRFTGKEQDAETGLYYFGARYLDPKTSRWLGVDPAMGEYVPSAPINEEAKKRNGNLPGMGGVFNYVNFHVYHYAGNNPVKYVDPNGNEIKKSQLMGGIIQMAGGAVIWVVAIAGVVESAIGFKVDAGKIGKALTALGVADSVAEMVNTFLTSSNGGTTSTSSSGGPDYLVRNNTVRDVFAKHVISGALNTNPTHNDRLNSYSTRKWLLNEIDELIKITPGRNMRNDLIKMQNALNEIN